MHGVVVVALKRYVESTAGRDVWRRALDLAKSPAAVFVPTVDYDDAEVMGIVGALAELLDQPESKVLEDFGRALVPPLVETYGFLIKPEWTLWDLVENTETTIHTVIRSRLAAGRPPMLDVARLGPHHVSITYVSPRRLCALARGILHGCADTYGEQITVTESQCMHRGDRTCRLDVTAAVPSDLPGQRAAEDPGIVHA